MPSATLATAAAGATARSILEPGLPRTTLVRSALNVLKAKLAEAEPEDKNSPTSTLAAENARLASDFPINAHIATIFKKRVKNSQYSPITSDGRHVISGSNKQDVDARRLASIRESLANSLCLYPRMRKQYIKDGLVEEIFGRWPNQDVLLKTAFSPTVSAQPIISMSQPLSTDMAIFSPAVVIDPSFASPSGSRAVQQAENDVGSKDRFYTLIMTYVDQPNLETMAYHESCHWMVTDIKIPKNVANSTYLYLRPFISPYLQLKGSNATENDAREKTHRKKLEEFFKDQFTEANRDPLPEEIDEFLKVKDPVSHFLHSKAFSDYLKAQGATKETIQDKSLSKNTVSGLLYDRTTDKVTDVDTGNTLLHYVPPHSALQYPKRKQRYIIYLYEQDKEFSKEFRDQFKKAAPSFSKADPKQFITQDREWFLPFLKMENMMKEQNATLRATNYFVASYGPGSDTLYRRLGVEEPVYHTPPNEGDLKILRKSASPLNIGEMNEVPKIVTKKSILAQELAERVAKQKFFVLEEYKRSPRPNVFEKAGALIRERNLRAHGH